MEYFYSHRKPLAKSFTTGKGIIQVAFDSRSLPSACWSCDRRCHHGYLGRWSSSPCPRGRRGSQHCGFHSLVGKMHSGALPLGNVAQSALKNTLNRIPCECRHRGDVGALSLTVAAVAWTRLFSGRACWGS